MKNPSIIHTDSGTWWLEAEDDAGLAWIIAEFNERGINIVTGISNHMGWNLNEAGALKVVENRNELLDKQS